MRSAFERLITLISYSEMVCIKGLVDALEGKTEGIIVTSKIADKQGMTRSVLVNALKLLEAAGVIESRSLGMKGTFVKINDIETIEKIIA